MASHRRTAAAAVAVALASVSLYPIFTGLAWFWIGCASAIVVALTGTLTRLRRLPVAVALLGYVAGLLLWLNFAFSNAGSLWHLLPTPASLATLFRIAGQGFNEASKYAPPVPELRGMLLLAAAGVGIAAAGTDLIAVRLESAALAGLPLLLLFTEPFTLSVSRGFIGTTIAFCVSVAGYLALLSSEGRDRIREWERATPAPRYEPDTGSLAAAGRRVGFASVVLALCLPLLIPGLHTTRLFGGGGPGIGGSGGSGGSGGGPGGGSAVVGLGNPGQQLASQLLTSTPVPVLSYSYNSNDPYGPNYLQVWTLGQLTDSDGWQISPADVSPADQVRASPSLPAAPGLTASGSAVPAVTTTIQFASSVPAYEYDALPVPYPATSVKASGTLTADKNTLMVFDKGASSYSGLQYTVTSRDPEPSQSQLAAAPPPPASMAAYTSLPAPYKSLKSLAVKETAGAKTEIQKALDLQNWLNSRGKFKYTLHAQQLQNAADLMKFLTVTKAGYCQQFSFAMAVLARELGIPSRVVWGYTQGTSVNQIPEPGQVSNVYTVTSHDAHAWPELYFQGYGWLRFEPTPGGVTGQATATLPSYSYQFNGTSGTGQSQTVAPGAAATRSQGAVSRLRRRLTSAPPSGQQAARHSMLSPWEIAGLVVAVLIVVGAAAPWCTRRLIRRRRWRRRRAVSAAGTSLAGGMQARDIAWAHAAWEELRDDLRDYGAPSLPSESPRTVAARAGTGLRLAEPARDALGRIAMAEERARYAPVPADGSRLPADSAAVRRAIAAAVSRDARWRARLFPASVVNPALLAVASVADLYRGSRRGSRRGGERGEQG